MSGVQSVRSIECRGSSNAVFQDPRAVVDERGRRGDEEEEEQVGGGGESKGYGWVVPGHRIFWCEVGRVTTSRELIMGEKAFIRLPYPLLTRPRPYRYSTGCSSSALHRLRDETAAGSPLPHILSLRFLLDFPFL